MHLIICNFFSSSGKEKAKLVAKTSMNLWRKSKSSNAKRAATRLEARKVRRRMRKTRFQQVPSTAKTPAALTPESAGFSSAFLRNSKRTVIQRDTNPSFNSNWTLFCPILLHIISASGQKRVSQWDLAGDVDLLEDFVVMLPEPKAHWLASFF